ncbi:hypothetical protein KKC32_01010 [Patescibacteria group bacterium]|nr:hypothetical protein [Patescibacteria group bacterium]
MNKKLSIASIALIIAFLPSLASARSIHSGRIYLQVESHGEAWYINPDNDERYYLGKPDDAYNIMRTLGLGITNADLALIPVGVLASDSYDSDQDGLSDIEEISLGTKIDNADSDNDDFSDKAEIEKWSNPLGAGDLPRNNALTARLSGKILLQVQKHGEAWYVNPGDSKRYFLGRASDAFSVMRKLGVGITNANLAKISTNYIKESMTAAEHYSVKYPNNWTKKTGEYKNKTYRGFSIIDDSTLTAPDASAILEIFVLQPSKDSTLGDLNIASKKDTEKLKNQSLIVGVKPAQKQIFNYQINTKVDDINFDKGAEYIVDIMVNTRKFIHLKMIIPNESDIDASVKILDQVLDDMQIIAD